MGHMTDIFFFWGVFCFGMGRIEWNLSRFLMARKDRVFFFGVYTCYTYGKCMEWALDGMWPYTDGKVMIVLVRNLS